MDIVERLTRLETPGKCTIIAIDGHGGAGKSTLAAQLAVEWNAEVVHTDDFASWECQSDWWPRLRDDVLEPLSKGETARFVKYDWVARAPGEVATTRGPRVIVEGVSSSRREFRPYLQFAIWVETPREVCLQRGLNRDGPDAEPLWDAWMSGEDAYIAEHRPQEYADLIVPGL